MPTALVLNQVNTVRDRPAHTVRTKVRWAAGFHDEPYLFCLQARHAVAPELSSAQFEWRYGEGIQHDADAFAAVAPHNLLGEYVQLEVTDGGARSYWHGVFTDVEDHRAGAASRQIWTALGMEYFLRRHFVERSWIQRFANGSEFEIHRALEHNAPNSLSTEAVPRTNRTPGQGPRGVYAFHDDPATSLVWTTQDILIYLLSYFPPTGANELDLIPWSLDPNSLDQLPTGPAPRVGTHGRALADIFDQLLDRRRGLGWRVGPEMLAGFPTNRVFVYPFTFASAPFTLPSGTTIAANAAQYTLDCETSPDAEPLVVRTSEQHAASQVVAQGGRARAIVTLSHADGTLEGDWAAAERSAYNTAASALAGYAAADRDVRQQMNARVRGRDDLARVFACFRLTRSNWDGLVRDGIGGTTVPWFPVLESLSQNPGPDTFFRPGLRFLNELPLDDTATAGEPKEQLRPLALLKVAANKYHPLDKLQLLAEQEETGDGAGIRFSAHSRAAEHEAALWIHVTGAPQHVLAKDAADFVALADDTELAEYDWRDDLIVTVAIEADRFCRAEWPESAALAAGEFDAVRRVLLDLGDQYHLDWIPAGTVIGLAEDGALVHQTASGWRRDDRGRLLDIARLAYAWYGRRRQAISLHLTRFWGALPAGAMLTAVGATGAQEEVNAVVTSVEWDLARHRTRIVTDYAELDAWQA